MITVVVPLPESFHFGVATSGFQSEGGYNQPGLPTNNWADWEASGRVERSGEAIRFWDEWETHLDRAVNAGCSSFRLSVEWARCEPGEGELDDDAFAHYSRILDGCHERGLHPLVTLHHFTHPLWLGAEFWLDLDAPERFRTWARTAVDRLGERCADWVTLNEPNILVIQSWLTGMFPPGERLEIAKVIRALDALLTAHVLAYDEIRAAQPYARVSTNTYAFTTYEFDRLLVDLLLCRRHGVARDELGGWLAERRADWHAAFPGGFRERVLRRATASFVPLEKALPRAAGAVFAAAHETTIDSIDVDYYDPVVTNHVRLPGHTTSGGRNWLPGRMLWDDPPNPAGLTKYLHHAREPGLPVRVIENGLCNRVADGRSYPRLDGWTRPRYLEENIEAVAQSVAAGVPVEGYWHWTLADNYEWGSYEPRFGLYGIERDPLRWSDRDSMGDDSAGAYRDVISRLRAGPRPA